MTVPAVPAVPAVPVVTAVQAHLSASDVEVVRGLVEAVTAADGTAPLSDHVMLHLPGGGDADVRHLLVRGSLASGGEDVLVGYAHLDVTDQVAGPSAELLVHPEARGRGIGRALTEELLRQSPDGRLRLWAHGEHPGAAKLAASLGFERFRSLWQMRRPLAEPLADRSADQLAEPLPPVRLPDGIVVRTFVVGQDEQAWTALNNKAFAGHPEQGNWGIHEVLVREGESWFDPAGIFLAFRGEKLVGSHWTKVHGAAHHPQHAQAHEHAHEHAHEQVGEVYVVGVDPSEQGRGLGPALTLLGLHYLRDRGLREALLYVDEDNRHAIGVYERLGFTRSATDVCFSRTP